MTVWLIDPRNIALLRIEKEELNDFDCGWNACLIRILEYMRRIEAEPVRHGTWTYVSAPVTRSSPVSGYLTCSECGAVFVRHVGERWKGCPSCLTRMYDDEGK